MQLYSYIMQFANRLPFSQHLVLRYSESPAVPHPNFSIWGTGKNFCPPKLCTKFPPLPISSEVFHEATGIKQLISVLGVNKVSAGAYCCRKKYTPITRPKRRHFNCVLTFLYISPAQKSCNCNLTAFL